MDPLIYVVALFGCGDAGVQCQPVGTEAGRYSTKLACLAAAQSTLVNATDLPFPTVEARCEQRGLQMAARTPR